MGDFRGLSCGGMSSERYKSPEIIQVSLRSSPCLDWSDLLQTALEIWRWEKKQGGVMGATMSIGWPYR